MAELKELRKFMCLTQRELAEKTGINIRQIQKIEKGEIDTNNITAKNAQALSGALGCSVEEMLALNLNIFSAEVRQSIKDGKMDLHDLLRMDKYQKIKKLSKIGNFESTFYENYKWIPEELFDKLTPEDLANLVDRFYECYSAGKNAR
nr:MAG TPA: helix-turn-helix domain protein [Caudoviricetes sp.]